MAIKLKKINDVLGHEVNYHRIIETTIVKDEGKVRVTLMEYPSQDIRENKDGVIVAYELQDKIMLDKLLELVYNSMQDIYKGGVKV
jgi:hypothetical protein